MSNLLLLNVKTYLLKMQPKEKEEKVKEARAKAKERTRAKASPLEKMPEKVRWWLMQPRPMQRNQMPPPRLPLYQPMDHRNGAGTNGPQTPGGVGTPTTSGI